MIENKNGFTLIEVLVASIIMAMLALAILGLLATCQFNISQGRSVIIATGHMQILIEAMRAQNNPEDVVNTNWSVYVEDNNLNTLRDETFTITYPNGGDATPLTILIRVNWKTLRGRNITQQLATVYVER